MAQNQAGITALITAYTRAYHAAHDDPKIFDDFLAGRMFTAEERAAYDGHLARLVQLVDPGLAATQPDPFAALARVMQVQTGPVTLSRSRYTEDCLEEAVRAGVGQYVLLGAGMDTFAFRRPELATQLAVFEVDHPATQAMKRERIAQAGWEIPTHLHLVPVDFTTQTLAAALLESAYDREKLSFFSWLGVTYYLPREAVFETLRAVAGIALRGSTVVFDYLDTDAFVPEKCSERVQRMQWITQQAGEPMKAGFDPLSLADDLSRLGFRLDENLSPAEIEARYFLGPEGHGRADAYHAFEHVHFAKAVVG